MNTITTRHRSGLRAARRAASSRRGQALLVAVLVLFGVATLAALFIGILGAQVIQVARYADAASLRQIAQAGLAVANHDLVYGIRGADWRPREEPIPVGNGEVRLKVSYGPTAFSPQSRYILVSATATFPDNPFASYSILGVKPLLLTDYARCITDLDELHQPAALGVSGVEAMGLPRDYTFVVDGPIFSNTDLVWYGPSEVDLSTANTALIPGQAYPTWGKLGILRDDRIEVSGIMRSAAVTGGTPGPGTTDAATLLNAQPLTLVVDGNVAFPYAKNVFAPDTASKPDEVLRYQIGFPDLSGGVPVPNTWRVLADLPNYAPPMGATLVPGSYSVSRIQPPRFDAIEPDLHTNRYLMLTRDSGRWQEAGSAYVNAGAWGWGWTNLGGIYIDNDQDIQYNHDLEQLRLNWTGDYRKTVPMNPQDPNSAVGVDGRAGDNPAANWWDKTGRYYAPPGVEIILHGEGILDAKGNITSRCPYIEIVRDDPTTEVIDPNDLTKNKYYYWKDRDGNKIYTDAAGPYLYAQKPNECLPMTGGLQVQIQSSRAIFPFPPNGVIYAEGNVRIRGILPPARNAAASPAAGNATAGSPYFSYDYTQAGGRSRHYDLQVVSGGTIYIEGDLLSPTGAGFQPAGMHDPGAVVKWDKVNGTRLALLARDSVCVNTTALMPRPNMANAFNDGQTVYHKPEDGLPPSYALAQVGESDLVNNPPADQYTAGSALTTTPATLQYEYHNARLLVPTLANQLFQVGLGFMLGHSAWYKATDATTATMLSGSPKDQAKVDVELKLTNGTGSAYCSWSQTADKEWLTFQVPAATDYAQGLSQQWYQEPDRLPTNANNNYLEFVPLPGRRAAGNGPAYQLSGNDTIALTPRVYPVVDPNDPAKWLVYPRELGYIFGPIAIAPPRDKPAMPVRIEAMVYAERGSWFVLPGPWFNEDPDEGPPPEVLSIADPKDRAEAMAAWVASVPYPVYHEPLNVRIDFVGAISENMPAPVGDVADWTSKWGGPLTGTGSFLRYTYDPLLRQARVEWNANGMKMLRPRFPNLPLTPDLLVWGERVSGFSTAGL